MGYSNTGFRCPKCRQTERFTASAVLLVGEISITPDGYDWAYGSVHHSKIPDAAIIECCECEHTGAAVTFLA